MTYERVADYTDRTGEGPLWHPDEELLYWVDIPEGELYRYDPETAESERVYESDPIGGFTIQENGDLLLFMADGAIRTWNEGIQETLYDSIPEEEGSRFNDVIADPDGRVYCGTMPPGGNLYRLDTDGRLTHLFSGVKTSNGMGFTPELDRMYYSETGAETVWVFDYDRETGDLRNREALISTDGGPGRPDGMTVDEEGYLWVARWNGGCVVRHAPDGRVVDRVQFPARKVSCITFGGPDYTDAYVTTATGGGPRSVEGDGAGALFKADLGVGGVLEFRSDIDV